MSQLNNKLDPNTNPTKPTFAQIPGDGICLNPTLSNSQVQINCHSNNSETKCKEFAKSNPTQGCQWVTDATRSPCVPYGTKKQIQDLQRAPYDWNNLYAVCNNFWHYQGGITDDPSVGPFHCADGCIAYSPYLDVNCDNPKTKTCNKVPWSHGVVGKYSSTTDDCKKECQNSWNCSKFKCTDPKDGTGTYKTSDECEAACTNPTYDCINDLGSFDCVDPTDGTGTYKKLEDCKTACKPSFNCNAGKPDWNCSDPLDGTGTYPKSDTCKKACVKPQASWVCSSWKCFDDGTGKGEYKKLEDCQAACKPPPGPKPPGPAPAPAPPKPTPPPPPPPPPPTPTPPTPPPPPPGQKYKCVDGICNKDSYGAYTTLNECNTACPAVTFNCNNGTCSDPKNGKGTFAGANAKLRCMATCLDPPQSWNCNNGKPDWNCKGLEDDSGKYPTQPDCMTACVAPQPPGSGGDDSKKNNTVLIIIIVVVAVVLIGGAVGAIFYFKKKKGSRK